MMKRYYIQTKKDKKIKLLDAIKDNLNLSREEAEKLIYQGSVWNSKRNVRLKDKNRLIQNELICINKPEFPILEYTLDINNIKYEDDDFIIVYKEAGLNTCQTPLSDIDCLTHGVQKYIIDKKIDYSVSTINRLDKPTKGLVFYAKNKKTEITLHEMFKARKIKKLYLCLTPQFKLEKESYIIKDQLEWKGKLSEAITYIKFLKDINRKYYFIVYPLTGRTHQIRKHFQKYLIPIYGDALYGDYSREDEMELICISYCFKHPYRGKRLNIEFIPDKYKCL